MVQPPTLREVVIQTCQENILHLFQNFYNEMSEEQWRRILTGESLEESTICLLEELVCDLFTEISKMLRQKLCPQPASPKSSNENVLASIPQCVDTEDMDSLITQRIIIRSLKETFNQSLTECVGSNVRIESEGAEVLARLVGGEVVHGLGTASSSTSGKDETDALIPRTTRTLHDAFQCITKMFKDAAVKMTKWQKVKSTKQEEYVESISSDDTFVLKASQHYQELIMAEATEIMSAASYQLSESTRSSLQSHISSETERLASDIVLDMMSWKSEMEDTQQNTLKNKVLSRVKCFYTKVFSKVSVLSKIRKLRMNLKLPILDKASAEDLISSVDSAVKEFTELPSKAERPSCYYEDLQFKISRGNSLQFTKALNHILHRYVMEMMLTRPTHAHTNMSEAEPQQPNEVHVYIDTSLTARLFLERMEAWLHRRTTQKAQRETLANVWKNIHDYFRAEHTKFYATHLSRMLVSHTIKTSASPELWLEHKKMVHCLTAAVLEEIKDSEFVFEGKEKIIDNIFKDVYKDLKKSYYDSPHMIMTAMTMEDQQFDKFAAKCIKRHLMAHIN